MSNIDITLSTAEIAGRVRDWSILPDLTISDHNAIRFKIAFDKTKRTQQRHRDLTFNIKKANWDRFDDELTRSFDSPFKTRLAVLPPCRAVAIFTEKLQDICKRTLGVKKPSYRTVPWWNDGLTVIRRRVQAGQMQLHRVRRLGLSSS